MNIFSQGHTLMEEEQQFEDGLWEEIGDRIKIDSFYLTGNEEGFLFELEDIPKLFETKSRIHFDFGYSNSDNWCGIQDEDDYETNMRTWKEYKSKFPRITSREQFQQLA